MEKSEYLLLIARLEPENNISMAIEGYVKSEEYGKRALIVVGKTNTPYGKFLTKQYRRYTHVRFVGGIYEFRKINSLRHFSLAYFHGHSVGGTNPSLLEAMASGCFIFSHDNIFNRSVLGCNAMYYKCADDIRKILNHIDAHVVEYKNLYTSHNTEIIKQDYLWEKLIDEHEKYFEQLINNSIKNDIQ